jgi:hypothetical protein
MNSRHTGNGVPVFGGSFPVTSVLTGKPFSCPPPTGKVSAGNPLFSGIC